MWLLADAEDICLVRPASHERFIRDIYLTDYNIEREDPPPPDDWMEAAADQVWERFRNTHPHTSH